MNNQQQQQQLSLYQYLTSIYGIHRQKANKLAVYIGANPNTTLNLLSNQKKDSLNKALAFYKKSKQHNAIAQNLKNYRKNQIKRLVNNNSLKGKRLKLRLPARGQRTRSNARNAKRTL